MVLLFYRIFCFGCAYLNLGPAQDSSIVSVSDIFFSAEHSKFHSHVGISITILTSTSGCTWCPIEVRWVVQYNTRNDTFTKSSANHQCQLSSSYGLLFIILCLHKWQPRNELANTGIAAMATKGS